MISDIEKNRNNNIICYFQNRVKGKGIGAETPPPTTATAVPTEGFCQHLTKLFCTLKIHFFILFECFFLTPNFLF